MADSAEGAGDPLARARPTFYQRIGKRWLDAVVALIALIVALPLLLVVALVVLVDVGRPVLFRQVRPGRGGRSIEVLKLRTMRATDPSRGLVDDESRLTRTGRVLRAASLDELPSLWNVVRGDLSLVGPRPLLPEYLPRYTPRQTRRHEVRPGLTGLAQVSGRNAISWDERLELDATYVDRVCLSGDLRILARTVLVVLFAQGTHAAGHSTMPVFDPEESNG